MTSALSTPLDGLWMQDTINALIAVHAARLCFISHHRWSDDLNGSLVPIHTSYEMKASSPPAADEMPTATAACMWLATSQFKSAYTAGFTYECALPSMPSTPSSDGGKKLSPAIPAPYPITTTDNVHPAPAGHILFGAQPDFGPSILGSSQGVGGAQSDWCCNWHTPPTLHWWPDAGESPTAAVVHEHGGSHISPTTGFNTAVKPGEESLRPDNCETVASTGDSVSTLSEYSS
ncbi:hypothetical protein CALVIDRAFT_312904 [Calocera viscosa TUFC12733]|uniref:Uncharacterized protein n=1 Tax=Calocera viscosa (strain TUFC12733) TaxID=1330018 RepID=A0A167I4Z6_CALVF|nr:hypothetical protein CALVIDRAFT_312904 [Calocera viscosa TUFC12733]